MILNLKYNFYFSNDRNFVTGSRNGTVSLWKDGKIVKSTQLFNEWTLVFHKDGCVFAASKNNHVFELNMNLESVKKFSGRNYQPYTMDVSNNYLVIGYRDSGYVDVYSRKEDTNGTEKKIMVSSFEKYHDFDSIFHRNTSINGRFVVLPSKICRRRSH